MDIDEIIRVVSANIKNKTEKNSGTTVYHDEPIIRTARQLTNYVPDKIRQMRKITADDISYRQSLPCLFYRQAKFMEDYEDDYEYRGNYNRYLCAYQFMDDKQLRGYFSWRTKVRHGNISQTLYSFVLVYIYELINMIGVRTPQEGFDTLRKFWNSYREFDDRIDENMKAWLFDYVVYYNLDRSLLGQLYDPETDNSVMTLINYKTVSNDELFDVIALWSPYDVLKSRLFRKYPREVKKIVCDVYIKWDEYCQKNKKRNLCGELFDNTADYQYVMFPNALFYDHLKYDEYIYSLSDVHNYICKNNVWTCEKYTCNRDGLRKLGNVLKNIDCILRQRFDFGYQIKPAKIPLYLCEIINSQIELFFKQKEAQSKPQIKIDISKLQDIRMASEITRDKLIVDEEESENSDEEIINQNNASEESMSASEESILDQTEYRLMQCMLYGESYDMFLKQKNIMLSVVIDSINEKLFDMFGDTVIVFDGDTPEIIEDYADQLKGIILK